MKRLFAGLFAAAIAGGSALGWGQEDDLFAKLDANKDGVVSADELTEDRARRIFERLVKTSDKDGDKKLSKEEFQAGLKDQSPDTPSDVPRRPTREPGAEGTRLGPMMMEEMFKKFDANSDGKLTEEEVPERFRRAFLGALERLDDDGDKALTKEQAPRFMMIFMQPPGPPERMRPDQQIVELIFNQLDANKDGKLTADEIPADRRDRFNQHRERVAPDGEALTKEQFAPIAMAFMAPGGSPPFGPGMGAMPSMAVLRALDADNNGELSKEEIENASKALAKLDKNEDGKLSREELMPGMPGGFPGGFPGRPGDRPDGGRRPEGDRPAPNAEQIRARLKEMDANGDGKISKDEARGPIKENFERVDANGDGSVDVEEVVESLRRIRDGGEGRRPDGDRPQRRRPESESGDKAEDKE